MDDIELARSPRAQWRHVFLGSDGLRAGWSLALFLVLVTVLVFVAVGIIAKFHHPAPAKLGTPQTPLATIGIEAISFAVIGLAAFLVALVERRPFSRYGLRRTALLSDLLAGMVWGLVMLSLLIGLLAVTGALAFDGVALDLGGALRYGALWLLGFGLVGLFEEFLTRGFLQYTLARGVAGIVSTLAPGTAHARTIGFWVSAVVFSVGLFAVGHVFNTGETAMGLVSVALAGLTFAYALYRTGSLWWAIGFHSTWDWAQSFLYGVPDSGGMMQGHLLLTHPVGALLLSGGPTGPEGSVLIVPTLLLTLVVIRRTLPRRATAFDA